MKRKNLFTSAVTITALSLSIGACISGCGKQRLEPVMVPTVEEVTPINEEESLSVATEEETISPALSNSDLETYNRITEELDRYMADQDFENLFSQYSTYKELFPALSDKLEEKKTQYVEQIMAIFDEWIAKADELTVAGDSVNAKEKINDIAIVTNIKYHFEELDVYDDISYERLSCYSDYNKYIEPVNLMGKEFDTVDGCYYHRGELGKYNKYEDRFGNIYDEYYELQVRSTNTDRPNPYVIFNADTQYEIFHAEFVCHNRMEEYNEFHVEVYGDDTQLYVSDTFSSYNDPMTIDVDITGYRLIKFVAVREDYNLPWGEGKFPSVGLYQAAFSHSKTPEFEYYIPQKSNENE